MASVPPSPSPRRWPLLAVLLVPLALLWWLRRPAPALSAPTADPTPTNALTGPRDRPTLPIDPRRLQLASIAGTVTDLQNHPLANARVCANPQWDRIPVGDRRKFHCTITDRDGRYQLTDLLGIDHRVVASAAHHVPATYHRGEGNARRDTVVLRPAQAITNLDLALESGGVEIHGTIKDLSGGAVEAAQVSANDGVTFSDADGNFSAWVRPGTAFVTAGADGYTEGHDMGPAPGHHFDVYLTPESVLIGKLVRAADNTPVADAWVSANGSYHLATFSDAHGNFRIDGLKPGPYKPEVEADEWIGKADEQVILGLGETSSPIVVKLHPATHVEGTITVADGGTCENGRVTLTDDAHSRFHFAVREPGGSYRARGVLPGDYTVKVECEGLVSAPTYPHVIVTTAPITGLTWPLTRGQAIRGRVLDSTGAPLPNVRVFATPNADPGRTQQTQAYAHTDAAGQFTLGGLLPGPYRVGTQAYQPPRPPSEPRELTLPKDQDLTDITLELPATGEVRGTVRDARGQPITGVHVWIEGATQSQFQSTQATDQGSFQFPFLAVGDYRVTARRGYIDALRAPGTGDDDVQGSKIQVAAGGVETVALVVEDRGHTLRGVVRSPDGAPVADAFIDVVREPDSAAKSSRWSAQQTRWDDLGQPHLTDSDGRFSIDGVADKPHTIRAHRRGGGEALLEHATPGSDNVLTIADTGRMSGTVVVPGGPPPEQFDLTARDPTTGFRRHDSFFRTAGAWSLAELPAGTYRLSVITGAGSADTETTLEAGQELTGVRIELAPRVTVRGTLIDLEGRPAAGLAVTIGGLTGNGWANRDDTQIHISDASGRFTVHNAPSGSTDVMISADHGYAFTSLPIVISPTDSELPPIRVARTRVEPAATAGDLGYRLKDAEPGADPLRRRLIVAVVRPGGPAATAGLKPGDEITAIDGHDVTAGYAYLHRALTQVPVTTVVQVTLARGLTLPITAAAKP